MWEYAGPEPDALGERGDATPACRKGTRSVRRMSRGCCKKCHATGCCRAAVSRVHVDFHSYGVATMRSMRSIFVLFFACWLSWPVAGLCDDKSGGDNGDGDNGTATSACS